MFEKALHHNQFLRIHNEGRACNLLSDKIFANPKSKLLFFIKYFDCQENFIGSGLNIINL